MTIDTHESSHPTEQNIGQSYLSPKLELGEIPSLQQHGVFAHTDCEANEVLAVFTGDIVSGEALESMPGWVRCQTLQIEEGLYLCSLGPPDPADYVNHSCDPNAGMRGQIVLVSMRPIRAGEQVTFDYAMAESSPYDEFDCACGTSLCRGRVRGDDWRRPELRRRYAGYFSPYLARRIALESAPSPAV